MVVEAQLRVESWQQTFCYYDVEVACAYLLFHENTTTNRFAQGIMFPFTRRLSYYGLSAIRNDGFAFVSKQKHALELSQGGHDLFSHENDKYLEAWQRFRW